MQLSNSTGVGLVEAVKYFIKHARPGGGMKTMIELADEVLAAKAKAGRREKTLSG